MESGVVETGRVRRSESQWRELIEAWMKSGQSQEAFCRERGIALSSLGNWRRRFKGHSEPLREPRPREAGGFIELRAPMEPERASPSWDVELALGDQMVLRLRCTRAQCR